MLGPALGRDTPITLLLSTADAWRRLRQRKEVGEGAAHHHLVMRSPVNAVRTTRVETRCPACGAGDLCLPLGREGGMSADLERLFDGTRRLRAREALHRFGEPFTALHIVRVGMLKTVTFLDGREQITAYHMPGDVVGIEGFGLAGHASDVLAVEDSEVGTLPAGRIEALSREPIVLRQLFELAAADLRRHQHLILLLGTMRAGERVAAFLLNLGSRHAALGRSAAEFVLRVTRREIASFLGLELETVSRVLSILHRNGLIRVHGRTVRLLDGAGLRRICGHECREERG